MYNLVKKLKQAIYKDTAPESTNNKDNHVLCSVNIELSYDNEIGIRYFWPQFDSTNEDRINNIAQSFGTLLFLINEGHIKADMVETLSHTVDKDNTYDRKFTEEILQQWLDLINISKNNPIVSPSTVFGQYKQ
jgi:hypothetical protein